MPAAHHRNDHFYRKLFEPVGRVKELEMLLSDDEDYSRTHQYLEPLIATALSRFEMNNEGRSKLHKMLMRDVPLAATRYLTSEQTKDKSYSFSSYFTWYISERINESDAGDDDVSDN